MLYTGKGDTGTTGLFGCNQRISKSSAISEALGSLDEVNSFLGLAKLAAAKASLQLPDASFVSERVGAIQQDLFIIQAELAGTPMTIEEEKVASMSKLIELIEKALPPIRSFFVSGGTELAATLDVSRTLARRAERRIVAVKEEGKREVGAGTLAYLNRLSSILYAFARYANHAAGIKEESPSYK